jgi:hypothetical protein
MTAARSMGPSLESPSFSTIAHNDDGARHVAPVDDGAGVATITMRFEPLCEATAPVSCAEVRDGRGRLVAVFDGDDGVRVLGEAIEHCRERGLDVRAITDGANEG